MWKALLVIFAFCLGGVGVGLISAYVATVIKLFVTNAADKSLIYWYLVFLLGGVMLCRAAYRLYVFVRWK